MVKLLRKSALDGPKILRWGEDFQDSGFVNGPEAVGSCMLRAVRVLMLSFDASLF